MGTVRSGPLKGAPRPRPRHAPKARRPFEEARLVVDRSPRSAAALLRLSLQRLCEHLGRPGGGNPGGDPRAWVERCLPGALRQGLRDVRAAGADAVPPGQIDARDDGETAGALFDLLNSVVERMITEPAAWRRR
jgi:hypothetical protein